MPRGYSPLAQLLVIDPGQGPVGWFSEQRSSRTVLTATRRPQRVELVIPKRYRADVILGNVSTAIDKTLARGGDTDD